MNRGQKQICILESPNPLQGGDFAIDALRVQKRFCYHWIGEC